MGTYPWLLTVTVPQWLPAALACLSIRVAGNLTKSPLGGQGLGAAGAPTVLHGPRCSPAVDTDTYKVRSRSPEAASVSLLITEYLLPTPALSSRLAFSWALPYSLSEIAAYAWADQWNI